MAMNGHGIPDAHYPSNVDMGSTITQRGFKITTRKLPILKAAPIEQMTLKLGIAPPEMIFGDNSVSIEHIASGWSINFNTFEALNKVDKTGASMLQVAHSKEWQSTRYSLILNGTLQEKHQGITEVVKPFDWSYTTDYMGSLSPRNRLFTPTSTAIPLELLKRPDPIIFFDEVVLYEDEMADNGITMLSCKVRVMPARLLLLCRFFMRLDNVLFRLRDTRLYIDFSTCQIIREYVAKEDNYEAIRLKLTESREDALAQMRDPNRISELLPVRRTQYIILRPFSQISQKLAITQTAETLPISKNVQPALPSGLADAPASAAQGLRPQTAEQSPSRKLAQEFRKRAPETTETYVAYGVSEALVKECAKQADYSIPQAKEKGVEIPKSQNGEDLGVGIGWWYEELGLIPTFNTWAQITFLHMYLLTVRIRCFPAAHAPTWNQHMINHFSYLAEERMVTVHNIQARMVRNKYLKDLFVQWRGLTAGYDEGLMKGDAVLAAAVWRNVCKADENVDLHRLGMVVAYIRSVLSALDTMDDSAVATGDVVFGSPDSEAALVKKQSKMMNFEFASEDQASVVL
ncbi:hypothetical protein MMC26_006337 [Xylographa opegraphella]|nr:hypothetical protein [Xylographa opegraphella]